MELGELVLFCGRAYYLRGLDPMSVTDRHAHLDDAATGVRIEAPIEEVEVLAAPAAERAARRGLTKRG